MSMRSVARRIIAASLLVLVTACYSWRPTAVSPQTLIPAEQPSSVRVRLTGGEVLTFQSPMMRNDSIVGVTDSNVGVASRDVRLFEVRRFSVGKTVVLGVVLAGLALGASIVAYCSGSPSRYKSC